MKRLLCLFLALVLFPLVSLANDHDPIVGCWYMYFVSSDYPFLENQNENMIALFIADDNYVLKNVNITFNEDGSVETKDYIAGQWKNENGVYYFSIFGDGTKEVSLDGDVLSFDMFNSHFTTHRMLHMDMYAFTKQ